MGCEHEHLFSIVICNISLADPVIKKQIELNKERLAETNIVYACVGNRQE